MIDTKRTAAEIIARAKESYSHRPGGTDSDGDAFDLKIATEGVLPYGELYQETYALANEGHEVKTGDGQEVLDKHKSRADLLWRQVLPKLNEYADDCRSARYSGWSRQLSGPVRRLDPES